MIWPMNLPEPTLAGIREALSGALADLADAAPASTPAHPDEVTPALLGEAVEQLFEAMERTEANARAGNQAAPEDVSGLGEYALELLEQALDLARRARLGEVYRALEGVVVSTARWIGRHGGSLQRLEPVVDALAQFANTTRDPGELLVLYEAMNEVTDYTADIIRRDLEKTNPGRPWRVLNMNRAIVATRTHQPDVMDTAFRALVENLPEDAPGFFAEGMEQMDLLNYPPHVREVMDRYYRKWSIDRSLH